MFLGIFYLIFNVLLWPDPRPLCDGMVELKKGELFVVPKGAEHKPSAEKECEIMLVEPVGTINTGDIGDDLTAEDNVWI